MDQPYYKHTTIQPVLDTIFNKYCKFLLKTNEEDMQSSQQQSPDDIEQADEVIHQLATIEDMDTLPDKAIAELCGMFGQLQLCHEKSAKLAGHLVQLSMSLTPKQYTYVMKHSLCPLIQLSLPPRLCSPADLKFQKLWLTPQETKEEQGINLCLPHPFHPALAKLPAKHATHCLAVIIHTNLHCHLFQSKESANTICEQFQVAQKKLYEGITGKQYDMGQKLTKDEKAAHDAATSTTPPKGTTMEVDDGASKPDLQKDASKGGACPKKSKKLDTEEV